MMTVDLIQHSLTWFADITTWTQMGAQIGAQMGTQMGAQVGAQMSSVIGSIPDSTVLDSTVHHAIAQLNWNDSLVFAQQLETDSFKGFRAAMDYFIKSGQVWALLIGLVVGYIFKSLTSYG
jgi:hypothetical protein